MLPTKWHRAPDKTIRYATYPVMLWLKPGDLKAVCGTVVIDTYEFEPGKWRCPIRGGGREVYWDYSGMESDHEPTREEFEAYVQSVLEALDRDGKLHGAPTSQ
jgi:hypothetical protein